MLISHHLLALLGLTFLICKMGSNIYLEALLLLTGLDRTLRGKGR